MFRMRADVSDASQALMDPTLRTSSKARSRANRTASQALPLTRAGLAALLLVVGLSGCGTSETFVHGQKITQEQLQQAPVGASREQVELALGTPSTTGVTSNEVFYYISQTDVQPVRFLNPRTVDRRILAVYFDSDGRVREIAEYGLKDGKVFDFIARKTPTTGEDLGFVSQVLKGVLRPTL
jgi:outer membrane protein assembly factor BamE (lipoprotein component of BamABCDE complex)